MKKLNEIEKRIQAIEDRNRKVDLDKAWEISLLRKVIIALLTYIVIVLFFIAAGLSKPFINPIVPTGGFLLSTLSLSYIKKRWIQNQQVDLLIKKTD